MKSFRIYVSGTAKSPTPTGYVLLATAGAATAAAAWVTVRRGIRSDILCALVGFITFAAGSFALRFIRIPVWRNDSERPAESEAQEEQS